MALFGGLECGPGRAYPDDGVHRASFASALSFSRLVALAQKNWRRLFTTAASGRSR